MDNVTCNVYNGFADWPEKCRSVAYDVSIVRLPSLNRIGICQDIPSIGPLLTYHSQLDGLEVKQNETSNDVLWMNKDALKLKLSTEEESKPESVNMLKKRGSIVEARLAFVADMVETKTNQENGEVEEISRKVECFRKGEDEEKMECFSRDSEGTLQRFECIRTAEDPLKVKCYAKEYPFSDDSSLACSSEESQIKCQIAEDIQSCDQFPEEENQREKETDYPSCDQTPKEELQRLKETDYPSCDQSPKEELQREEERDCVKIFHNESKDEQATRTLEDIERERRIIIENQVVRRKKIETWTLDDCTCQNDVVVAVVNEENSPSLQISLEKYNERKQKQNKDLCNSPPTFVTIQDENCPIIPNLVDFGSILEKKQELKHFWERKMMEVVAPNMEETRLPPVVVNGHCKLKQNGVIKCQETGMIEPEMYRRPSPEGEESTVLSETVEKSSLEKHISSTQEKISQKEENEEKIKNDDDTQNEEKETKIKKEVETTAEKQIEKTAEKETEEIKDELDSNMIEEVNIESENTDIEKSIKNEVIDNKEAIAIEKPIIPEIEITTCGENQIDEEEKEVIEEIKDESYVESVLDREIRMQKEREETLAKERESAKIESGISELRTELPAKPIHNQVQPTERPYCNQTTESRIALEIREMREREEELKRMRENIKLQPVEVSEPKEAVTIEKEQSAVIEKKSPVSEILPSNLGLFKRRDRIKVRPLEDVDEDKPIYRMSKESPIEREIRLLKEREEELRREKGLEIPPKKIETQPKIIKERTVTSAMQKGDTQRLLATNRIQQEIEEQTRRELDLRETGHIRTISRDMEEKPMNGSACKNSKFLNSIGKGNMINGVKEEGITISKPIMQKKDKIDARFPLINRRNVSAESKIQQELLEMKAREEELRQQRLKIFDQSQPNLPVLINGNGKENSPERIINDQFHLKDQNKIPNNDASINSRRRRSALIAQWEQRIQNAEGKS